MTRANEKAVFNCQKCNKHINKKIVTRITRAEKGGLELPEV